jgi:putative restriction endonuclease
VRARVNQGFFRAAVLAAYDEQCCVTGLAIPQLLNASHIVPWAVDTKNRTNPQNGLCLNALHDKAFDCGLLTVTTDLRVKLSDKLKTNRKDNAAREFLQKFEGVQIRRPRHFAPDAKFLQYHNENVFVKS